jgi:tetratricopeptide (TPR) repeat protein
VEFCARSGSTPELDDLAAAVERSVNVLDRPDLALAAAHKAATRLLRVGPLSVAEGLIDCAVGMAWTLREHGAARARVLVDRARVRRGRAEDARSWLVDALAAAHIASDLVELELELEVASARALLFVQTGRVNASRGLLARLAGASISATARLDVEACLAVVDYYDGQHASAAKRFRALVGRARSMGHQAAEARGLLGLGGSLFFCGDPKEAEAVTRRAAELYGALGDAREEARATANAGLMAAESGDLDVARDLLTKAIENHHRMGDTASIARSMVNLAAVETEAGRTEAARRTLERALSLAGRQDRGLVLGELGKAAHFDGTLEEAIDHYDQALRSLSEAENHVMDVRLLALLGAALAEAQDVSRLDATEARLAEATAVTTDAQAVGCVGACTALMALARARAPAAIQSATDRARQWIEAESCRRSSLDGRFATALLRRALGRVQVRPPAERGLLVFDVSSGLLRLPSGKEVQLATKGTQRRLLQALLLHRIAAPGSPLDAAALFAAGWPGQVAGIASAHNRVYVAISALRKLGLRSAILRRDDGYLLDPSVPVAPPVALR